jgi:hypothetical protein
VGSHVPVNRAGLLLGLWLIASPALAGAPKAMKPASGAVESAQVETVSVLDAGAARRARLVKAYGTQEADGLVLHAEIYNPTNRDHTVQVQVRFRDAVGNLLGDDTSWATVVLNRRSTTLHEVRSLRPDAATWSMAVRTWKRRVPTKPYR